MSEDELKNRFHKEIFINGPEAWLPTNLSDEWLDIFLSQADCMHKGKDREHFGFLVSTVLQILFTRSEIGKLALTEDELFGYLNSYSLELSLEKINRVTDVQTSSATLQTILTDRTIEMVMPHS